MSIVCGVDLGGSTTKIVVVDADLRILGRESFVTDKGRGPQELLDRLDLLFTRFEGSFGELRGVGISMAGLVDDRGRVAEAPNLPRFVDFDLVGALRERRKTLVLTFENDVNCAIVGEHRHGAGRGSQDLCMLSLGTGVGGGMIVGGRLFRGSGGLAGEFGHLVIVVDGERCTCGKPGHVEAYLSTPAIVSRARRRMEAAGGGASDRLRRRLEEGRELTPRLISELATAGDELCREILAESGRYLGAACASVAHAVQPQKILVGGGVSGAGSLLLEPARRAFEAFAMDAVRRTVGIDQAELGAESAAIGAACLALDALDENSPET